MKLLLIFLLPTILLAGCSMFPDEGKGGMAEHQYSSLSPVMTDEPMGPEHGLRFEWELSARHLDILIMKGAQSCFPAAVIQNQRMQDRIIRELHAGLDLDAANDLIIQRAAIERLEKQLDAVQNSRACAPAALAQHPSSAQLADRIFSLLNTDNQFAVNSSKINPKYMGHLAEAAHLLRDLPQFNLHITGHANSIGSAKANKAISLKRAEQVKRYLLIFGLPSSRLTLDAVGANNPLFESNEKQARLINRRVSIELLEPPQSLMNFTKDK